MLTEILNHNILSLVTLLVLLLLMLLLLLLYSLFVLLLEGCGSSIETAWPIHATRFQESDQLTE
jgi:hypothetical protein